MANKPQLTIMSYAQGSYITVEGKQNTSSFFIIQRGNVRVLNSVSSRLDKETVLLKPGDFIGVLAAMSAHEQIETTKAETDVQLICVDNSQFEGLIQHNTGVAIKILVQFSRQLRTLNNAFAGLTIKEENSITNSEILYANGQYYNAKEDFYKAFYCYKRYLECYPGAPNTKKVAEMFKNLQKYNHPAYTQSAAFIRTYQKGNFICAEGEAGGEMYIIQAGRANITKISNNTEMILTVLKAGDMFGEMSLLDSSPRSASVVVQDDCTVMVVNKENFEMMAATKPQLIGRLTRILAERIWYTQRLLVNTHMPDPHARFFDMLCILMEQERVPATAFSAYIFNLSIDEILKMANITPQDKRSILTLINENQMLKVTGGKLSTSDVMEIIKLADYYKKQIIRRLK